MRMLALTTAPILDLIRWLLDWLRIGGSRKNLFVLAAVLGVLLIARNADAFPWCPWWYELAGICRVGR